MRLMTPPITAFESSQRRSAARLVHCSAWQCAEGNCCSTAFSVAPSATPFASYAAPAGRTKKNIASARSALIRLMVPSFSDLPPPEAALVVVVHHADRLHEGVDRRRSDEAEAAFPEILRERLGTLRRETPDVPGKAAELAFHFQHAPRVLDGGVDLAGMAHDACVRQQTPALARAVRGDLPEVEAVERAAVVVALGEDRVPGQSGLRALERQTFEELALVAHRHAPFLVVVGDGERVARPGTALLLVHGRSLMRWGPRVQNRRRGRGRARARRRAGLPGRAVHAGSSRAPTEKSRTGCSRHTPAAPRKRRPGA